MTNIWKHTVHVWNLYLPFGTFLLIFHTDQIFALSLVFLSVLQTELFCTFLGTFGHKQQTLLLLCLFLLIVLNNVNNIIYVIFNNNYRKLPRALSPIIFFCFSINPYWLFSLNICKSINCSFSF